MRGAEIRMQADRREPLVRCIPDRRQGLAVGIEVEQPPVVDVEHTKREQLRGGAEDDQVDEEQQQSALHLRRTISYPSLCTSQTAGASPTPAPGR